MLLAFLLQQTPLILRPETTYMVTAAAAAGKGQQVRQPRPCHTPLCALPAHTASSSAVSFSYVSSEQ